MACNNLQYWDNKGEGRRVRFRDSERVFIA